MYEIIYVKPIPRLIRKTTKEYLEILDDISPTTHRVIVYVLPLNELVYRGKDVLGYFVVYQGLPQIELAAYQGLEEYKNTLCHEWSHLEQYRDGKVIGEAGVNVRARNLVNLVESERILAV